MVWLVLLDTIANLTCYYFAELCEITDIYKILRSVKEKWEKIGLSLGLSDEKLRQIKAAKNGDPARCLYATIDAWIHKRDVGRYCATWRTLFRALESAEVNEAALAKRIKQEKGRSFMSIACYSCDMFPWM